MTSHFDASRNLEGFTVFAPPQEIQAEVFAELPKAFHVTSRRSEWAFGKANPDLYSFIEGICFAPDGRMFVSDIPWGRVFEVSDSGTFSLIAEYDGEPNGMSFAPDGRLYIADHRRGIVAVEIDTGKIEFLLPRLRREGFKGLNDLVFDTTGNLYFNDQGQTGMQDPTGRVYRMTPDGNVSCLIDTIPSPNGMAISADGRSLYVAVTRANQVWRLPIHADGSCTKAMIFLHMQGGATGPDGLALDPDGNLLVCQCGTDSAWLFSPWGEPLLRIRTTEGFDLTSAVYGGPDGSTLFLTESQSGKILKADLSGHSST